MPEAAVSSWESAVDMVEAKMPARTIPAMMESVLHSLPVSTFVNSRMLHFHNI